MKIVESHIMEDGDKRYRMCDDIVQDLSDTYMGEDATIGDIFRASRKEHGRCTGKVFLDKKDGTIIQIGWVFVKRERYEDSRETFIHETWISLYDEWHSVPVRTPHVIG